MMCYKATKNLSSLNELDFLWQNNENWELWKRILSFFPKGIAQVRTLL
jgi:hypothetical protein